MHKYPELPMSRLGWLYHEASVGGSVGAVVSDGVLVPLEVSRDGVGAGHETRIVVGLLEALQLLMATADTL